VKYRLRMPDGLPLEALRLITLICEVAARAGREKVDWPQRENPQDYPQTDGRKFPTAIQVHLNGLDATTWHLPDDPADARGVLSHWRGVDRGSYGYLMQASLKAGSPQGDKLVQSLARTKEVTIAFEVPENAPQRGGIALYGENMGCYPLDPTLMLRFSKPLPLPHGWTSTEPVAADRFRDRQQVILPSARRGAAIWRYTTGEPPADWLQPHFNDSSWREGKSGFGMEGTPGALVGTQWHTGDIWLRKTVTLSNLAPEEGMWLEVHHDEDCEIYVNGHLLWRGSGYLTGYRTVALTSEQKSLFFKGANTIAVHCHQTVGGQFVDAGLVRMPAKP